MAISIVNGFVCSSSCDVSKAKKGEDPNPLTGAAKIAAEKEATSEPLKSGSPAVVLGGALAGLAASKAVQPLDAGGAAGAAALRMQGAAVDVLVCGPRRGVR